jgi:hypothetical protein
MATRTPVVVLSNLQLSTSLADSSYTVPANSTLTISAATLNNTTASVRTATVNVIPSGGSASASNEIASGISVAAAGATPVVVSALIGQHITAGGKLQMKADAATAVTPLVSGYLTTQ